MSVNSIIDICFLTLILLSILIGFYHRARKRRTMGQILFQYPISRAQKILLCLGIVWCTGVVLVTVGLVIQSGWQSSSGFWPMICPICILFCMLSMSRFEVRTTGLWDGGKFTKWEKLTAFQWKAEGNYKFGLGKEAYILGLHKPGDPFPWWLELIKFQRDQREAVDKLLVQHLPKATGDKT